MHIRGYRQEQKSSYPWFLLKIEAEDQSHKGQGEFYSLGGIQEAYRMRARCGAARVEKGLDWGMFALLNPAMARCNNSEAWLCLDSNLSTSYTTQAISNKTIGYTSEVLNQSVIHGE